MSDPLNEIIDEIALMAVVNAKEFPDAAAKLGGIAERLQAIYSLSRATAAPVVVGEDLWSLFLKHRDDISTNVLMVGTDDELTAAVRTAALAGDS